MVGVIRKAQATRSQALDGQQPEPTPTGNRDLPFRLADFGSLSEALDYAAKGETGINFYSGRGHLQAVLPYARLRERAVALARRLLALNPARGDRIAITAEMEPDFVVAFFACQYAGLQAVPLPVPTGLGGRQGYEDQLRRVLRSSQARIVLSSEPLLRHLHSAADGLNVSLISTVPDLEARAAAGIEPEPPRPDAPSHGQGRRQSWTRRHGARS